MKNEYDIRGKLANIYLRDSKGKIVAKTIVNVSDLDLVKSLNGSWCMSRSINGNYYVTGYHEGENVRMHRWIMKPSDDQVVDHINGKPWDNRRSNLRICSHAENTQNRTKIYGKSKVRGVTWNKKMKKWQGVVVVGGKQYYREYFDDIQEAESAVTFIRSKVMPFSKEATEKGY